MNQPSPCCNISSNIVNQPILQSSHQKKCLVALSMIVLIGSLVSTGILFTYLGPASFAVGLGGICLSFSFLLLSVGCDRPYFKIKSQNHTHTMASLESGLDNIPPVEKDKWQNQKLLQPFYISPAKMAIFQIYLEEKTSKDKEQFLKFSMNSAGHQYLGLASEYHQSNETKLKEIVNDVIACQNKGNTSSLAFAFSCLPRVTLIIDRMRNHDAFAYLEAWVKNGAVLNKHEFDAFVCAYGSHLELIEQLQAQKSQSFKQQLPQQERLKSSYLSLIMGDHPEEMLRLDPFDKVMLDAILIQNKQMFQYCIDFLYLGATSKKGKRCTPELRARYTSKNDALSYGLYNQIGVSPVLVGREDDELIEYFKPSIDLYITDYYSMETRCIHFALPIEGKMSVNEAKKQLRLLSDFIGFPDRFDERYEKLALSKKHKDETRKKFRDFDDRLETEYCRALGDFNSTPTRIRESAAREKPEIQAFIQIPHSKACAIQAAKLKNIFLLNDRSLSLLPSGPGEMQRSIGTLTEKEYTSAAQLLLGKLERAKMAMPDAISDGASIQKATLSIVTFTELIDQEFPFLIMETTIELKDKKHTRKTYYKINESVDALKQQMMQTRLFERDILLAKAEFFEKLNIPGSENNPKSTSKFHGPVPRNYVSPLVKRSEPLSKEAIQNLKEQAATYASTNAQPTTSWITQDQEAEILKKYLFNIIDDTEFQKDPVAYMEASQKARASGEAHNIPEDDARNFFKKALDRFRI